MGKCIICWFGKDEYFLFNLLVMDFIDFLEYLEVSKLFISWTMLLGNFDGEI